MALNELQRERVNKLVEGGMSFDKAYDQVKNEAAVDGAKKVIKRQTMSRSEAHVRAFLARTKAEAKLKVALERKAKRERYEKLSKKSIEELKDIEVKKD